MKLTYPYGNFHWLWRIPKALYGVSIALLALVRGLMMVLDALVSCAVLLVIGSLVGWWFHWIPEDDVVWFVTQSGLRLMSLAHKSGIY